MKGITLCRPLTCLIILFITGLLVLMYTNTRQLLYFTPSKSWSISNNQTFTILFYNIPHWLRDGTRAMNFSHCDYSNCRIVDDANLLSNSQAVIFSGGHLPQKPPSKRLEQIWIFFSLESPYHLSSNYKNVHWRKLFNWTMTYRKDSDVCFPYAYLQNNTATETANYDEIVKQKERSVAWIVSHCQTPSKREKYVAQLQKYMVIDIYGGCGKLKCSDPNALNCYKQLSKKYKFYLSFENSLCKGYYTEKVYYTFFPSVNMVPIIRGGPGIEQYFPTGTYISTSDFSGPKHLAEYITKLTDERYIELLKRQKKFVVPTGGANLFHSSLCSLCRKMNSRESSTSKIVDVEKWLWDGICIEPNDFK